jgi:signal transduction histidine kinase
MGSFRDASIRTKLTLLMVAVVSVVLLLLCIAFMFNDVRVFRRSLIDQQSAIADVLGANSTAALQFLDQAGADEVLSSLRLEPTVVFACIYDAEGDVFAQYQLRANEPNAPARPEEPRATYFADRQLHVFREITQGGDSIGTIYIRGSMEKLTGRLIRNGLILSLVLIISLGLVFLVSARLQRVISDPILRLAQATQKVSSTGDYSIRVKTPGNDELGTLYDGFNDMLSQIQKRDAELEQHRNHLEEIVHERTSDLEARTRELARTNEELERSNQDLDDFAYIASHDLKEPLRGIANYSTFLAEDYAEKLDDEGREKLDTLKRLCARMDTLITSLLHYSRVGRAELAVEHTDLDALVSEVLDSLRLALEEQRVQVRIPEPLPKLRCDAVRIREVFHNLITNAIKYNDKPEKWIEIGCRRVPASGDNTEASTAACDSDVSLIFYIQDNGIGIRERHLESVFRIFKRLHGRDKFGGGSGAGLTFVKQIVERHGGRVWVESTPGEGSTFYFTLQADRRSPTPAE